MKKTSGYWSDLLKEECKKDDAERARLAKFFREHPGASAFSVKTFPLIPLLSRMAELEKRGISLQRIEYEVLPFLENKKNKKQKSK